MYWPTGKVCLVWCAVAAMELPMPSSSSALAAALSDASQLDSQADSVPTPEPPDPRRARALLIACVTMALERFGFYTLVALFVLFLVDHRLPELAIEAA